MTTLGMQTQEVPPDASLETPLRIRLIGPRNARVRAFDRRLRVAGIDVDALRTDDDPLQFDQTNHDALLLVVEPPTERADIERLRAIRQIDATFPIIAVAGTNRATKCLDAGADDCVVPMIDPRELEARIRARLRRNPVNTDVLRLRGLTIDFRARTVTKLGKEIRLTPREFSILEMLVTNRGKVVSRVMIWQRLYDENSRYTSNVVDVYIRYLRRKIDLDAKLALIKTVWGRGYMFGAE